MPNAERRTPNAEARSPNARRLTPATHHLPSLPILLPPRPPALDIRIEPQTPRPPHRRNRDQVPNIQRLHMRRHHINLPRRIPLLPTSSRRMHRLHLISPTMQPPRPLHLHPIHRPTRPSPHHKVIPLAVSPRHRHIQPQHPRLQQKRRLRNLPRPLRTPPQPLPPLQIRIRHRENPRHIKILPTRPILLPTHIPPPSIPIASPHFAPAHSEY